MSSTSLLLLIAGGTLSFVGASTIHFATFDLNWIVHEAIFVLGCLLLFLSGHVEKRS